MKLSGKRALITGSNQGFGLAVAETFAAEGASVMLCARDTKLLSAARDAVTAKAAGGANVASAQADISSESSIKNLVEQTHRELGGLDILVANAGVYGPKGAIDELDANEWAQWVQAININLVGTVFCCRAVLPAMKAQKSGKIILLSGGGATKPMPNLSAYAASKAAMVRFGETLADEVKGQNIQVNSVAPGALNTRLLDEILAAGPEKVGKAFYDASIKQRDTGGHGLERGANLCVFLASNASDGVTGRLISAVWDPWEKLPELADELSKSDIYTLRRIAARERGKDWENQK